MKLTTYIKDYNLQNKYITNEMLRDIFSCCTSDRTENILTEVIKHNTNITVFEQKQLQKIIDTDINISHKEIPNDEALIVQNNEETPENKEFNFIKSMVFTATNLNEIEKILIDQNANEKDVNKIILEFYKERKILWELKNECFNSEDPHYLKEKEKLEEIIAFLIDYREKLRISIEEDIFDENINIIYFHPHENLTIFEDCFKKTIPAEAYEEFIAIFENIKQGYFKNNKFFSPENINLNLGQIRIGNYRVLYHKISADTIVIIYSFIKKVYTSIKYKDDILKCIENYYCQVGNIRSNIDEYLKTSNEEFQQLIDDLRCKKRGSKK